MGAVEGRLDQGERVNRRLVLCAPSAPVVAAPPSDRHLTIAPLGHGGMADIHLALQKSAVRAQRLVAIKRVRPDLARSEESVSMFLEEARIATSLSHPNIVQTYEVGQDDDGYFLVMEFLRGHSYQSILAKVGYPSAGYGFSIQVLLAALRGLEYMHDLADLDGSPMRLIHRDISPSNIFVGYDGQVKLLDFGIAKASDSDVHTGSGVFKGKIGYIAPEQVAGGAVDARADLYAVGVMLWEATAGRRRWSGLPESKIAAALVSGTIALSPSAQQRGLPPLADEICSRALAHDPEQRYLTAAEFRDDLSRLARLVENRDHLCDVRRYVNAHFLHEARQERRNVAMAAQKLVKSLAAGNTATKQTVSNTLRLAGPRTVRRQLGPAPSGGETEAARHDRRTGVRRRHLVLSHPLAIAVQALFALTLGIATVALWLVFRIVTNPPQSPPAPAALSSAPPATLLAPTRSGCNQLVMRRRPGGPISLHRGRVR